MKELLIQCCSIIIFIGFTPLVVLFIQFLLVGFHGVKNHYPKCKDYTPRVAIIIPVWNEQDVIGLSIDSLMQLNYPPEKLRIYAIDDVSTDKTPEIIAAKTKQYPNQVFNIRRPEKIDFGKAAVINHGLQIILNEPWAEAILIMDADVMFEANTLLRMARHLADPKVGAVTAYIKEGHHAGNLITRSIGFEYIVAQAATRRAQNVLGVLACLAGGAQLHSRENIEEIGGRIDTSTLAEDTYTTILTQLNRRKAIFDGNAIAIAEEPTTISDLWKQRMRWSEGNVQISIHFSYLWFHHFKIGSMGGIIFGLIWFSTLFMPLVMVTTSIALNVLYLLNNSLSWTFVRIFSIISLCSFLFTTFYSFLIDPKTARRVWLAGILFPGLLSIINMLVALMPHFFSVFIFKHFPLKVWLFYQHYFIFWINSWISLSLFFAWLLYRLDRMNTPQFITNILLFFIGYGPLLAAITCSAYVSQLTKKAMKWNKTVKTGKAKQERNMHHISYDFKKILDSDKKEELRLLVSELLVIMVLTTLGTYLYIMDYYE